MTNLSTSGMLLIFTRALYRESIDFYGFSLVANLEVITLLEAWAEVRLRLAELEPVY